MTGELGMDKQFCSSGFGLYLKFILQCPGDFSYWFVICNCNR